MCQFIYGFVLFLYGGERESDRKKEKSVVSLTHEQNSICSQKQLNNRSCVKMADRFASRRYSLKNKLGDRMIKQLLNSVIAKYRDLSVSRRSIIPTIAKYSDFIDGKYILLN